MYCLVYLVLSIVALQPLELQYCNKRSLLSPIHSLIHWLDNWVNEWVSQWVSEWVTEWVSECVNERVNEWMNEWMNEWVNEWVSEWMNEWMCRRWVFTWRVPSIDRASVTCWRWMMLKTASRASSSESFHCQLVCHRAVFSCRTMTQTRNSPNCLLRITTVTLLLLLPLRVGGWVDLSTQCVREFPLSVGLSQSCVQLPDNDTDTEQSELSSEDNNSDSTAAAAAEGRRLSWPEHTMCKSFHCQLLCHRAVRSYQMTDNNSKSKSHCHNRDGFVH